MRRKQSARAVESYNRVLLACYWLSDDGNVCDASDERIAAEAGRSLETTKRCLREMEDRDVVALFYKPGRPWRIRVILDHIDARAYLDYFAVVAGYTLNRRSPRVAALVDEIRREAAQAEAAAAENV